MYRVPRRSFLAGASTALAFAPEALRAGPRSDTPRSTLTPKSKLKVALIGCGGRANHHRDEFQKIAEIAWVCDPDKKRLADFEKATGAKGTTDLRRVLEDKDVQAVVISTPDHWHAPASILACNAGKFMLKNPVAIILSRVHCWSRRPERTRSSSSMERKAEAIG